MKSKNMKHLILFENYFTQILNESVENMKSGAKLYKRESEITTAPGEMIAVLSLSTNDRKKATLQFLNPGTKRLVSLDFEDDLEVTYKTKGGFGTAVVKDGGREIKGAGLIFTSKKMEGEGEPVTLVYQGKTDAEFSAALLEFIISCGGMQNFDVAKMAVNTIYELAKSHNEDSPVSLKRAGTQLINATKLDNVNILANAEDKALNTKLESALKFFATKLA
jgi:hypothetical protein